MRLIINADDLGSSRAGNDTIFGLMSEQRLTSATMIANGSHTEEAARTASRFPQCSFGIHLNITSFKPLSRGSAAIGALLAEDGNFNRNRINETRMRLFLISAIYREFCAQVETLLALGVRISHIDSHHHIHVLPELFPVLKLVQRKYRLRKVRIIQNLCMPGQRMSAVQVFKRKVYNLALRHCYATKTTDGFVDLPTFYARGKSLVIPHETVEVMTHPHRSELELNLLKTEWKNQMLNEIRLITYNEL